MDLLERDQFAREAACPECGATPHPDSGATWCPMCAWNVLADDAIPATGATGILFAVDGHEVLAEIARGGGGIVYRARQHQPAREVALKILPPHQIASLEMRARFRAEAETIAALDHPAILPVFAVGEHQEMPYFTMKLARGGSLATRRDQLQGDWRGMAQLLATLADAVHFAHAHGIIHRDLKPGNVLFDDAGRPYVADFGIAKFTDGQATLTQTQTMLGTPAYVAPEVAQYGAGAATIASDVYGLGAILYELLTGRPPFVASALPALVRDVIEQPPVAPRTLVPDVPRDLEIICLRCLAKPPAQRFATAAALADDLDCWMKGRTIASRAATTGERVMAWARRNPPIAIAAVTISATLLTAAAALYDRNVHLRKTVARATTAERRVQEELHASLVNEARLLRQTARAGQRAAALATLERAAGIAATAELRTEIVAALARPDLITQRVLTVALPARNSTVSFSADLSSYLIADTEAGFLWRDAGSETVLRRYRSGRRLPALYLSFVRADREIVATYPDRSTEVWAADAGAPWWTNEGDGVPAITHGGYSRREPVIALHPQGHGLLYVAADRSVRWVERSTGQERTVLAPAENIFELSFSPAGDMVLVVQSGMGAAYGWPAANRLWQHAGQFSPCKAAWHSASRRVAIGLEGRNDVLLCDAATGQTEEFLSGHTVHPRLLHFDRDGRRLFSVAWDGQLLAWNTHTGRSELTSSAFPSVLNMAADGRRLAFGLSTTEIAMAALEPGAFFTEFAAGEGTNRTTSDLAVSPDGRWLASIDNLHLRLWDARSAQQVGEEQIPPTAWAAVRFSPDGASVIHSGAGMELVRRGIQSGPAASGAHLLPPAAVAPGHPGLLLVVDAAGDWWVEESNAQCLVRWPRGVATEGSVVLPIKHAARTRFSSDGRYVATTRDDEGLIAIYETNTKTQVAELPVGGQAAIAFSPDGRWLLTGNKQGNQLWAVGTWQRGPSWPGMVEHHASANFCYSPDGALLAVRHGNGGMELRETSSYTPLLRLEAPAALRVEHLKWSSDGRSIFLLCTGHRVARWDVGAIREELARRGLDW